MLPNLKCYKVTGTEVGTFDNTTVHYNVVMPKEQLK